MGVEELKAEFKKRIDIAKGEFMCQIKNELLPGMIRKEYNITIEEFEELILEIQNRRRS